MGCDVSGEQLWSWIDRDAEELTEHLAVCSTCRTRAEQIRRDIELLALNDDAELPLPDRIGSYEIKRLLGEGGQALVFEAEQASPRRLVALKVLKGGHLAGKRHLKQFVRETQTLARLNHPGIATIFEAGRTEDGLQFFAMELVAGRPFSSHIAERQLSINESVELIRRICEAIHYAHSHGVIHRDLKPSNIIVDANGQPRVFDFGLARLTTGDAGLSATMTSTNRVEGTPRYMSPEQARGQVDDIDARSDVYSLGVMLYELLTGRPPHTFDRVTQEIVKIICDETPPRPRSIEPALSTDLEAVVLKAMEKNPDKRYQSAADLAEDLRRATSGEAVTARSRGRLFYLGQSIRRHRVAVAVVALVAVIGCLTAWLATRPTYDLDRARSNLLGLRCTLLSAGPVQPYYSAAIRARNRYPGLVEAILVEAQARSLNKQQNNAVHLLEMELVRQPDLWPLRILQAEIYTSEPDLAAAAEEVWLARTARPPTAEDWYLRSFATLDVARSLDWARSALRLDPDHRLALESVTRLSVIAGDTVQALAGVTRLNESEHAEASWLRFEYTLLTAQRRFAEALTACDRVIALKPPSWDALSVRAKILRRMGDYPGAVEEFTNSIELLGGDNPPAAWSYFHRGTLQWMVDRPEAAIADYQTAYRYLTYATFANVRLFLILKQLDRDEEADRVIADARANLIDDPWLEQVLACVAGDLPPERLLAQVDPADRWRTCEATYYAGEACLLQGRREAARQWFTASVETGAEFEPGKPLEVISEHELARWRLARMF